MTEQARHITIIGMGAVVALIAAVTGRCEHELYALAGIIVAGEFGLARSSPPAPVQRIDHPVTINARSNEPR